MEAGLQISIQDNFVVIEIEAKKDYLSHDDYGKKGAHSAQQLLLELENADTMLDMTQ
jgi:hypothetical protein